MREDEEQIGQKEETSLWRKCFENQILRCNASSDRFKLPAGSWRIEDTC
jgi:hypothetical protein